MGVRLVLEIILILLHDRGEREGQLFGKNHVEGGILLLLVVLLLLDTSNGPPRPGGGGSSPLVRRRSSVPRELAVDTTLVKVVDALLVRGKKDLRGVVGKSAAATARRSADTARGRTTCNSAGGARRVLSVFRQRQRLQGTSTLAPARWRSLRERGLRAEGGLRHGRGPRAAEEQGGGSGSERAQRGGSGSGELGPF